VLESEGLAGKAPDAHPTSASVIQESSTAIEPETPRLPEPQRDAAEALEFLGYDDDFRALFAEHADPGTIPARVVRVDRGSSLVTTGLETLRAETAAHLLKSSAGPEALPAVGDWVALRWGDDADVASIEAILPRRSAFSRADPGKAAYGQVLAANLDTVIIMHPIDREPNLRRIERELALAWDSGATPVVVLSKEDEADDAAAALEAVQAIAIGVDVLVTSAPTGLGMDEVAKYAEGHRTVAVIGPSGAGKSTLINLLVGGDVQAVAEVRAFDGKGRHTTVARELVPMPNGGVLIDTPGLRSVALNDMSEGVEAAFPEIVEFASRCKFDDCTHTSEPGCVVLAALEEGTLDRPRYESYLKLQAEAAFAAERTDARAGKDSKRGAKSKSISKAAKEFFRSQGR
jgi:ribosome biogenesis GTPase